MLSERTELVRETPEPLASVPETLPLSYARQRLKTRSISTFAVASCSAESMYGLKTRMVYRMSPLVAATLSERKLSTTGVKILRSSAKRAVRRCRRRNGGSLGGCGGEGGSGAQVHGVGDPD